MDNRSGDRGCKYGKKLTKLTLENYLSKLAGRKIEIIEMPRAQNWDELIRKARNDYFDKIDYNIIAGT